MKDKDYNNTNNVGWICPKCNKVNAPSVLSCDCSPVQQHIPEATRIPNPGTNPSGGWWGIFPPPSNYFGVTVKTSSRVRIPGDNIVAAPLTTIPWRDVTSTVVDTTDYSNIWLT